MRYTAAIILLSLSAFSITAHSDTVYKLKDESGATVYSDRPALQGTTNAGTVDLPSGPSESDQQAAQQRVKGMQQKSDAMEKSRVEKENERKQEARNETAIVSETATTGWNADNRPIDPKTRIPLESPGGGEHPVYQPREGQPVHNAPRSGPRGGR
jgi:hypothetical protein